MQAVIRIQGLGDEPQLSDVAQPILDLSNIDKLTFCIIQGGMGSGEPSVMIACETDQGTVMLQTSLDKYIMAGQAMIYAAETRWNWERPEGYATFMPPDKEAAKAMLLAIKKELEEWTEAEGEVDGSLG